MCNMFICEEHVAMAHTVQKLESESIILIQLLEPYSASEIPVIHQETAQLAAHITGKICRIVDMTHSGLTFAEVVAALYEGTRPREGGVKDARFVSVYVAHDSMSKLVVESLKQEQYGGVQVTLFDTVDEALIFARQALTT
jgi:hypothetical protein